MSSKNLNGRDFHGSSNPRIEFLIRFFPLISRNKNWPEQEDNIFIKYLFSKRKIIKVGKEINYGFNKV